MTRHRWTLAGVALALLWGVGPALPALTQGDLIGHGLTDLYPAVWGLWHFTETFPGGWFETKMLGWPDGMGFYFSSPIKGMLALGLIPLIGLTNAFNALTLAARIATVLCAHGAARAWGLQGGAALAAAAVYGCAPFFHGYAVEGIIEGTDGWTLALWAWAIGRRRYASGAALLALTVASSWYLGMVACLLCVLAAAKDRRSLWSLAGLIPVAPLIWGFTLAFPNTAPLDPAVRLAMGADLTIPEPGLGSGLQPFAKNTYIGFIVVIVSIWSRSKLGLFALIPLVLSTGWGAWYDLPVMELIRFPYRWHAATLALLALAVGQGALRLGRHAWLLAPAVALEGWLLSPVEPILPGTDPALPSFLSEIDAPVLDVPGPLSVAPGQANPGRGRTRFLLYAQTQHGQPSPWIPSFNSVGVVRRTSSATAPFEPWDPIGGVTADEADLPEDALTRLQQNDIGFVLLHPKVLGPTRAKDLAEALLTQGAESVTNESEGWLFRVPSR